MGAPVIMNLLTFLRNPAKSMVKIALALLLTIPVQVSDFFAISTGKLCGAELVLLHRSRGFKLCRLRQDVDALRQIWVLNVSDVDVKPQDGNCICNKAGINKTLF